MCTTILIEHENGTVLGRNMDLEYFVDYQIQYLPKGYEYAFDLRHNPMKSKYKMMGTIFRDMLPLKDGVNEHGLIGCTNIYHMPKLFPSELDPNKKSISSLDFLSFVLANYKSVPEFLEDLDEIEMCCRDIDGNKVIAPHFHHIFVDAEGRSVIIENQNKKIVAYSDNPKVMTNSPGYPKHRERLKKAIPDVNKFVQAKKLPGGYDPISRFIKASYMRYSHFPAETYTEALENSYSILETVSIPMGFIPNENYDYYTHTVYTTGYDTYTKSLTIRSTHNPTIYRLNFDDIKDQSQMVRFRIGDDIEFKSLAN
ncbi:MAG: linear amide C-N hydrolase [Finegoldia sp.]|nr:linear amide C-N hydrolase [Finegoldia sp.]